MDLPPAPRFPTPLPDLAKEILHRRVALYADPHERAPARLDAFPHLDRGWYDRTQRSLEAIGFRPLGDYEDLTLSRLSPAARTLERLLTGVSATVVAALSQSRDLSRDDTDAPAYDLEFRTEFSDGRFLLTSNRLHREYPLDVLGVTAVRCRPDMPLAELLLLHREAIADGMAKKRSIYAVPAEDAASATASARRLAALIRDHRRRTGYVTADEIAWLFRDRLTPKELDDLIHHVQNLALRRGLRA